MESMTRVQIQDKAACDSLIKIMNPSSALKI